MSREIRFRAWIYADKKMAYVYDLEISEGRGIGVPISTGGWAYTKFNECAVMQFTGLRDKNGVEIWEGDVVEHLHSHASHHNDKVRRSVEWANGAFTLDGYEDLFEALEERNIEVLGNIYQHPELLKGGNNGPKD